MTYFLTAIGLPPGGSSTVHIYTQTVHRTTQSTQTIRRTTQKFRKSAGRTPSLPLTSWHLPYNWGKARKILSHGNGRMPVGRMKTDYTEQNIH